MDFPIIDFFEDEGFITKERYLASNYELTIKQELPSRYKIDTAYLYLREISRKFKATGQGFLRNFIILRVAVT